MNIDTKQLRNEAQTMWTTKWSKTVIDLCDEIDRLREENAKQIRDALNDVAPIADLHGKLRAADHELQNCRKELAKLRDQLRPRSVKDEPAPIPGRFLGWNEKERKWYSFTYENPTIPHPSIPLWLPLPPAPPEPDKFLEWAEAQPWWDALGALAQAYMRDCWDAAKKDQP